MGILKYRRIHGTATRPLAEWVALALTVGASHVAQAVIINTSDPGEVAAFQAGATIETFDDLTGLPITSYGPGQNVSATFQFSTRGGATDPRFNSGGGSPGDPIGNPGWPVGIFTPEGGIAGDVASGLNVAGPLVIFSEEAFNNGFMEILFPEKVSMIGFWVTHGTVTLTLRDESGNNLSLGDVTVTGSAGSFIGISRPDADITVGALLGGESFTIDDLTYSLGGTSTPVPDAGGALSLAFAGGFIWVLGRKFRS